MPYVVTTIDTVLIPQTFAAGDATVIAGELIDYVPDSWTSVEAKMPGGVFYSLMNSLSQSLQVIKNTIAQAKLETRLATAGGNFLDIWSTDFFGVDPSFRLPRAYLEDDDTFRSRISAELLREHATPHGIITAVDQVTGANPSFFEPFNILGTGSWGGTWRTGGANFSDNQIRYGIGGFGSGSMDQFQLVDGSIGGVNPQSGVNALGDLGSASAYTFFVTVVQNPKNASLATIASVVGRIKPAGTVGYVTYQGVTVVV